jgi:hypothetical protein
MASLVQLLGDRGGPKAVTSAEGPDFSALESALLQSVVDREWERLAGMLSDDFSITTAGWLNEPAGKAEWLDSLASEHALRSFQLHRVDVRTLFGVAVVHVLSTQSATWRGAPFLGDFRYTDVWAPDGDGRWVLHVRHVSLLPQGSGAEPASL